MTGDGMTAADGRRTTDDQLFAGFMADGMPGISALVVRNGNVLLRASHGLADVRASMPCTPATNYRLASITKQFTAAMILLAYEHGLLKLEQSMCGVLPELPAFCQPITLHHLLNHTHGISDYEDLIAPETARPLVDADVLDLIVSRGARDFEPGSAYRYSNTGYALLAIIVERAFGVPFPEALRRFIFLPLGMATTLAYVAGGPEVTNRAFGHAVDEDAVLRADQSLTSSVLGDGGIYSNVDDFRRWDAALHTEQLLTCETLALAFAPSAQTQKPGVQYGYGWHVRAMHGERVLFHTGETIGFRNAIYRCPARNLCAVVLSNRYSEHAPQIALMLMEDYWNV